MQKAQYTRPLADPASEAAAVGLAAALTITPLSDNLEVLAALVAAPDPQAVANRAGFLLLIWDALSESEGSAAA